MTMGKSCQTSSVSLTGVLAADPGDVVIQKQRFAIFGTRAPACTTPLLVFIRVEIKYF